MSHVTLVRHGQANSAARTEGDYDRLSDLGHQQAAWLGEHFRDAGETFARAYCGTLRRHAETAAAMGAEDLVIDPRLNELEYFTLSQLLEQQQGVAIPRDREGFLRHMPRVFSEWQAGRIDNPPESFEAFETRTREALDEIAAGEGRALVVTSGGLIGMAIRIVMGLDVTAMSHLCLAIENSSVHRLHPMPTGLALVQFNALPHLEHPHRQHARSHL